MQNGVGEALFLDCTQGCSAPGSSNEIYGGEFSATQNGQPVTESNANFSQPIRVVEKRVQQGGWQFGTANGSLVHSYAGEYSDTDVVGLVTLPTTEGGSAGLSQQSGSVTMGAYFGGTDTTAADMSSLKTGNVTATYQGGFNGRAATGAPMTNVDQGPLTNGAEFGGAMTVTANFGSGAVTGNAPSLTRYTEDGPAGTMPYGVRFDGQIATGSNKYSGAAAFTDPGSTAAHSASPQGEVLGGFYGPGAAETVGVVRIQGTAPGTGPGTGANTTLIGAFGAKKQ
jgi:hypothetical protein